MIKAALPLLGFLVGAGSQLLVWRGGGPKQKGTKL